MPLRAALISISIVSLLAPGCALTKNSADSISNYKSPYAPKSKSLAGRFGEAASKIVKKSPADISVYRDVNYIAKDDPTSLSSKSGPLGPSVFNSAAALLEKKGDYAEAAKQYQRSLQADANNRSALIGLGRLYHQTGNMENANQVYQRALATFRNDPVIMNDYGLCLARSGRLGDAANLLHAAVQQRPDRQMYRNNLATVLVDLGRVDEAHAHLSNVYGEAVAHYNIGYLLDKKGHPNEALGQLTKALQIDPSLKNANELFAQINSKLRVASLPEPTPDPSTNPAYEQQFQPNQHPPNGYAPPTAAQPGYAVPPNSAPANAPQQGYGYGQFDVSQQQQQPMMPQMAPQYRQQFQPTLAEPTPTANTAMTQVPFQQPLPQYRAPGFENYESSQPRMGPFGYLPKSPAETAAVQASFNVESTASEPVQVQRQLEWPIRNPTGRVPQPTVGFIPPMPVGSNTPQPYPLPPVR